MSSASEIVADSEPDMFCSVISFYLDAVCLNYAQRNAHVCQKKVVLKWHTITSVEAPQATQVQRKVMNSADKGGWQDLLSWNSLKSVLVYMVILFLLFQPTVKEMIRGVLPGTTSSAGVRSEETVTGASSPDGARAWSVEASRSMSRFETRVDGFGHRMRQHYRSMF